jgi:hypothetical protein
MAIIKEECNSFGKSLVCDRGMILRRFTLSIPFKSPVITWSSGLLSIYIWMDNCGNNQSFSFELIEIVIYTSTVKDVGRNVWSIGMWIDRNRVITGDLNGIDNVNLRKIIPLSQTRLFPKLLRNRKCLPFTSPRFCYGVRVADCRNGFYDFYQIIFTLHINNDY